MPIETAIWKLADRPRPIEFTTIDAEARLEEMICGDLSLVQRGLMLIGRQVATDYGKFIDLLAMDGEGNLVVIELKRDRTPREVVAQLLDYASWVQGLGYEELCGLFEKHHDGELESAFDECFGESRPDELNQSHSLVVVCSSLDPSTERIIEYLHAAYDVPINAVFFRCFRDGDDEYLTRTWLVDASAAEADGSGDSKPSKRRGKREIWNGRDFYVSFGGSYNRSWDDARQYGFISAGGKKWYTETLYKLEPGHRVWVNIPKSGYVGVGEVTGRAMPMRDFRVEIDGEYVNFLDAPRKAYEARELDDDERTEHFVPVRWMATVPEDNAYWEKGLFASQHSACKMRNQFTLERLAKHFGI